MCCTHTNEYLMGALKNNLRQRERYNKINKSCMTESKLCGLRNKFEKCKYTCTGKGKHLLMSTCRWLAQVSHSTAHRTCLPIAQGSRKILHKSSE